MTIAVVSSLLSLGESRVAHLLVEKGERLLLVVVESILLAVAQSVDELSILASVNESIAIQVANSEDLLNCILARCKVNLLSDQGTNITVVRLINAIEVAVLQLIDFNESLGSPVSNEDNEAIHEPGIDDRDGVQVQVGLERGAWSIIAFSARIAARASICLLSSRIPG